LETVLLSWRFSGKLRKDLNGGMSLSLEDIILSISVKRGEKIAEEMGLQLDNIL